MPSYFEQYLTRREQPSVVVEMDDYRQKLFAYSPTEQEANNSLMLQVENSIPGEIAAMIAAASKKPSKLKKIPSSPVSANLRIVVNGGKLPNAWKPQSVLRQTALNMGKLGRVLQMAQGSVPSWNGSKIVVIPAPKIWSEPAVDGLVRMDRCGCGNTFKAGVFGKGLRMKDVGADPYGAFDLDPHAQNDFTNLIQTLQGGFESKPRLVKMFFHAPKGMREKLAQAGREAAVLKAAFIPPVPLKDKKEKKEGTEDLWRVRVDERLLGLPIDDVYWPAEDEPLEIRHLEMVKNEKEEKMQEEMSSDHRTGDRSERSEHGGIQPED
jgi:hypothetical protein